MSTAPPRCTSPASRPVRSSASASCRQAEKSGHAGQLHLRQGQRLFGDGLFLGRQAGLPGLSRHSVNGSLYYEDSKLSARISYNWRSRYNIGPDRDNLNAFGEAFGQWDGSFSYKFNDHVSVFLEGVNLFNAQRKEDEESLYRVSTVETYGRRIYFGVRGKM
jgi:iron complex outermembrane receptor protein